METRGFAGLVSTLVLGAVAGCGDTGRVTVQLHPSAGTMQALVDVRGRTDALAELMPIPATRFEMKILSAYLVEDVDEASMDNVGQVQRVWVNPDCPSANGCRDSDVGFFDLTDPTKANEVLNSQAMEIGTGTYRYVRVEFCNGGPQGNIVRYQTAAMSSAVEAPYGGCGVTSARMDPPVELKDGETITIALSYDLKNEPLYYAQGSDHCGSIDTPTPCLGGISLRPSIVP